jgi:hypothetical protein
MKKQTAVEWLEEQIKDIFYVAQSSEMTTKFQDVYQKAKAKEKEQIESAYTKGRVDEITTMDDLYFNPSWEKYYNETYK